MRFSVRMEPEGGIRFKPDAAGAVRRNMREEKMFSEKGGWQCKQNDKLRKRAHHTQIEDTVRIVGSRAELKAAALVAVVHNCGK